MQSACPSRRALRLPHSFAWPAAACAALLLASAPLSAQTGNANAPASVPAGLSAPAPAAAKPEPVSPRVERQADDIYLGGARAIARHDYVSAEKLFARAAHLDPDNSDYVRALAFARESRVTELVRQAAIARHNGDPKQAASLLAQAHTLDPDNRIVAEHLSEGGDIMSPAFDPLKFPPENIASTLAGPVELKPTTGFRDLDEHGDAQSVLRNVYKAYGINVQFDPSVASGRPLGFKLTKANFSEASQLVDQETGNFAVPVQPDLVLIAKNTEENRDRLVPQLEETVFVRGLTNDQIQELANLARNIFDVKYVTASATGGTILLRADDTTLKLVNAEYADMLDGGSDVILDVSLYELDKSTTRDYGVTLPSGISLFPVATELQSAITSNQSAIDAAVANNIINLTGLTPLQQSLTEIEFLYGAGLLSSAQQSAITGLLGTVGTYGGLPFLGVSIASGATVNALLQSSDVRIVDATQLRGSSGQASTFRSGTHYPIETSSYTSGVSSAASSALSGVSINGTSASSLLAQYGYGTGSVTVPQIQYEDLGLTLKATPVVQRNNDVHVTLDLKIEALGATALNNIPVLNNRQLTSTVTVPAGQTALLVSQVNKSEMGSLTGLPGLNELPGFQGTNNDTENDKTELLISITPHVVRSHNMRIVSRRLATPPISPGGSSGPMLPPIGPAPGNAAEGAPPAQNGSIH
jgi:type II secretory pathway component GspD/PulD (secretin)